MSNGPVHEWTWRPLTAAPLDHAQRCAVAELLATALVRVLGCEVRVVEPPDDRRTFSVAVRGTTPGVLALDASGVVSLSDHRDDRRPEYGVFLFPRLAGSRVRADATGTAGRGDFLYARCEPDATLEPQWDALAWHHDEWGEWE